MADLQPCSTAKLKPINQSAQRTKPGKLPQIRWSSALVWGQTLNQLIVRLPQTRPMIRPDCHFHFRFAKHMTPMLHACDSFYHNTCHNLLQYITDTFFTAVHRLLYKWTAHGKSPLSQRTLTQYKIVNW